MSTETKLTKDEEGESVDNTKYRGIIGSLLYLMASRPDIIFSVYLCARFLEDPKTSHLEEVKCIFRYIEGTTHLGLWYPKGSDIETVVYAESNHAGDYVNQKSTSSIFEYGVSNPTEYGVSSSLSNTTYSSQQINTAYPLPLDTAYRSSGTETKIIDFRANFFLPSFGTNPTDCLSLVSVHDKEFNERTIHTLKRSDREFRSSKKHFKSLSLDELRSLDFNLLSDKEYSEEEEEEAMAETMEQYMSKTRTDYGSGVARPKIDNKDQFELKGQFLKELRENTFSGSDNEDANEHIEKVLEIVDLFHVPNITVDQLMLRVFPISLTGAASRWLRNEPTGSIKTWEDLKTKFLNKYCPPGRTAKKIEEINNFQQEPDETLYQAWERFKELLMKCPQHYLTEMQEMPKQPFKKWLNTLKNGTMEQQRKKLLRLLMD
ncbi:retrovirus-related pol polyprotein from transposon TNT 1-94 [Tanacetum coccineum]